MDPLSAPMSSLCPCPLPLFIVACHNLMFYLVGGFLYSFIASFVRLSASSRWNEQTAGLALNRLGHAEWICGCTQTPKCLASSRGEVRHGQLESSLAMGEMIT